MSAARTVATEARSSRARGGVPDVWWCAGEEDAQVAVEAGGGFEEAVEDGGVGRFVGSGRSCRRTDRGGRLHHARPGPDGLRRGAAAARAGLARRPLLTLLASFVPGASSLLMAVAFALAFGVLIDAFIVRMTLVPAVLALVGRARLFSVRCGTPR